MNRCTNKTKQTKKIGSSHGWIIVWMEHRQVYAVLAKQQEPWQPQKMFVVILKCSSADESILSDSFVYKNKHVPCFIHIIYSSKYMFTITFYYTLPL